MNSYWYLWIIIFVLIFITLRQRKGAAYHHAAKLRRQKGEPPVMEELILKYMDKGVQVTTINDTVSGKLTHYSAGWLTLTDAKGREKHINADYIIQLKGVEIKY